VSVRQESTVIIDILDLSIHCKLTGYNLLTFAGMTVTNSKGKDLTLRGILLSATMDAPAKCLLQNFVQYNGFSGCPYCSKKGITVKTKNGYTHAYPFDRENPSKGYRTERTHENTMQHAYEAQKSKLAGKYAPVCGVKGYSWFMFIPGFDIIEGVVVDYMHSVLLGLTKMLMGLWFEKAHAAECWSISRRVEEIDRRLLNISPPNCISRAPRSNSKDYAHWKASEFWSFLFFYGVPCLWNILPDEYFQHFLFPWTCPNRLYVIKTRAMFVNYQVDMIRTE